MTFNLNISAKQLDPEVKYIPFKTNSRAFTKREVEEVIRKGQAKFNKLGIYVSSFAIGIVPNTIHAQTTENTANQSLTPQVMFEYSMKAALIGLALSVGTTMVFFIASGIRRQLGGEKNKKASKEWNTDIIKGFVQCLVAIPLVFALYYLGTTIFGQLDFSKNTFLDLP